MNKEELKNGNYWIKYNNKPGNVNGFIMLGKGDIQGRNIIWTSSFDSYVKNEIINDAKRSMLSYAGFRYFKKELSNSQVKVHEIPSTDIELNSFVEQFGILTGNSGSYSGVILNLYHKNYAYSCRLESPNEPDKKYLCSNIEYSRNERCEYDNFQIYTYDNRYAIEICIYKRCLY